MNEKCLRKWLNPNPCGLEIEVISTEVSSGTVSGALPEIF